MQFFSEVNTGIDPAKKIWGFHIHQELPLQDMSKALVIQNECKHFLESQHVKIDHSDVIKPGYGPHLEHMWELRVESQQENIIGKLGLAIAFMSINRFGLSAYIHPLMHDPLREDLVTEGRENQKNILWFGHKIQQNSEFFFNPPRDSNQRVVDTRTPRVMTAEEKRGLYEKGLQELFEQKFKNPFQAIKEGFHIHVDFKEVDKNKALKIHHDFLKYLEKASIHYTSKRIYNPNENGPHLLAGWEVKFERSDEEVFYDIGYAMAWLMCNRQNMPIFSHPVTWEPGDNEEEYRAHDKYAMFVEELPPLDLNFFLQQNLQKTSS